MRRRRARALVAVAAGLGCIAFGLTPVAGAANRAPDPAAAVRAEMARTERNHPGGSVPVYALVRRGSTISTLRTRTKAAAADALAQRLFEIPGVLAAGVDGAVHTADDVTLGSSPTNDPLYSAQWALTAVDYQAAWPTTDGAGATVAVLDTGVRADHQDLTGSVIAGGDCVDAADASECTSGAGVGGADPDGHGTHVAGIIAAHANNALGIAGAAPGVDILPVRVLDENGDGTWSAVAAGIIWAADHGADVVSMSLTGPSGSAGVLQAINYALANDVTVIAASGNNYFFSGTATVDNSPQYPASYSGVLSVGSVQQTNPYTRSSFSNTSSNVGIVAPGSTIRSTLPTTTSSYGNKSGTSMATPYVSGAAAMLLAVAPDLEPSEVVDALQDTATPLADSAGTGSPTGHGLVNPLAALTALGELPTTTTSGPTTTLAPTTTVPPTTTPASPPPPKGYWVTHANGRVRGFGLKTYGDRAGRSIVPIVAMGATATGKGYWLAGANGAVYRFGDAISRGSLAGRRLNAPIVAMAVTKSGKGYWLMGADGGIFSFGDAKFYGSTGSLRLKARIVDIAATPTGKGYWLVGADGGIFSFGDAKFAGSTGSMHLSAPVTSMAAKRTGSGYWLIAIDGGVFAFKAKFYGSLPGRGIRKTVARLRATSSGAGYWMLASDGSVHTFGDAPNKGATLSRGAVDLVGI